MSQFENINSGLISGLKHLDEKELLKFPPAVALFVILHKRGGLMSMPQIKELLFAKDENEKAYRRISRLIDEGDFSRYGIIKVTSDLTGEDMIHLAKGWSQFNAMDLALALCGCVVNASYAKQVAYKKGHVLLLDDYQEYILQLLGNPKDEAALEGTRLLSLAISHSSAGVYDFFLQGDQRLVFFVGLCVYLQCGVLKKSSMLDIVVQILKSRWEDLSDDQIREKVFWFRSKARAKINESVPTLISNDKPPKLFKAFGYTETERYSGFEI